MLPDSMILLGVGDSHPIPPGSIKEIASRSRLLSESALHRDRSATLIFQAGPLKNKNASRICQAVTWKMRSPGCHARFWSLESDSWVAGVGTPPPEANRLGRPGEIG